MARRYICDNCGKDVRDPDYLNALLWRWMDAEETFIGEYCGECSDKIEKRIKEGVN